MNAPHNHTQLFHRLRRLTPRHLATVPNDSRQVAPFDVLELQTGRLVIQVRAYEPYHAINMAVLLNFGQHFGLVYRQAFLRLLLRDKL